MTKMHANKTLLVSVAHKGQTLLFVLVAVSIALAVGISASTRTLSSVQRTTRTDTSSREYAAAEGAAELALTQPVQFYADLAGNTITQAECGTLGKNVTRIDTGGGNYGCKVTYGTSSDAIQTQAVLTATAETSQDLASLSLPVGKVKEVALSGSSGSFFNLCWDNDNSAIYYVFYATDGSIITGGLYPSSDNFSHSGDIGYTFKGVTASGSNPDGHKYCRLVPAPSNNAGLRLRSLYNSTTVGVYTLSSSYSFPLQGYVLTSKGTLANTTTDNTSKIIEIHRSLPYLSGIFDYALYSDQDITKWVTNH
jgi:hypothetical protein